MLLKNLRCCEEHPTCQCKVDDYLLQDIENGQRRLCRHGELLELLHQAAVLPPLVVLSCEAFHGLEIYERVSEPVMQLIVMFSRRGTEALAPQGDLDRQVDVQVQVQEDEHGKSDVLKVDGEDEADHDSLDERGHEVEADVLHGLLRSCDAAVHGAYDVAQLLPEVPVQRHAVQVREGGVRDLDVRSLLHPDVNQGLELLEGLRQEAQERIHDQRGPDL
mmetsp:Transcript_29841/g.85404  ORF Transcript_29841/g.85404 Transcript_29841/m.85404 type:complete len:219 (-) Transcript_29841:854-1510(-)